MTVPIRSTASCRTSARAPTFPHPEADPFCVKFDKTSQNLSGFGIVDFAVQEPARLAAAGLKCFYYQQDEWTGSIDQGAGPELWHWKGGYWFDKARGLGGVSVREFRLGGVPLSAAPYVPDEYRPYFDATGGGGVQVQQPYEPGLGCEAMVDTPEERSEVFRNETKISDCIEPGGGIGPRRIGAVKLGATRDAVQAALGEPQASKGRADTWCVTGGEYLQVVFRGEPGAAVLIRTTAPGQTVSGVGVGTAAERAQRKLGLKRLFRVGRTRVFEAPRGPGAMVLVGVRSGSVAWIAVADESAVGSGAGLRRAIGAST